MTGSHFVIATSSDTATSTANLQLIDSNTVSVRGANASNKFDVRNAGGGSLFAVNTSDSRVRVSGNHAQAFYVTNGAINKTHFWVDTTNNQVEMGYNESAADGKPTLVAGSMVLPELGENPVDAVLARCNAMVITDQYPVPAENPTAVVIAPGNLTSSPTTIVGVNTVAALSSNDSAAFRVLKTLEGGGTTPIFQVSTEVPENVSVQGPNSASKFSVRDSGGNSVMYVNTVQGITYVSGGGLAVVGTGAYGKFQVHKANAESIFSVDTIGDAHVYIDVDTSIQGGVNLFASNNEQKLSVYNLDGRHVFNVDTENDGVSIDGTLTVGGANAFDKFKVTRANGESVFSVDTLGGHVYVDAHTSSYGALNLVAANDERKLSVYNADGRNVFYVDTVNEGVSINGTLSVQSLTGGTGAFTHLAAPVFYEYVIPADQELQYYHTEDPEDEGPAYGYADYVAADFVVADGNVRVVSVSYDASNSGNGARVPAASSVFVSSAYSSYFGSGAVDLPAVFHYFSFYDAGTNKTSIRVVFPANDAHVPHGMSNGAYKDGDSYYTRYPIHVLYIPAAVIATAPSPT